MAKVEMYTTAVCPYCVRAKDLLKRKGVSVTEYRVDTDDAKRDEMLERSGGRRTVPMRVPSPAARGVPRRTMRRGMVVGSGLGGADQSSASKMLCFFAAAFVFGLVPVLAGAFFAAAGVLVVFFLRGEALARGL